MLQITLSFISSSLPITKWVNRIEWHELIKIFTVKPVVMKNQVQDVALKSMKSFSTLPPNINTRYLVDSEFAMLEKV